MGIGAGRRGARGGLLATVVVAALALSPAAGAVDYDVFQSPSGNIRCGYANQVGVACYTRNNDRGVGLRSFDRAYYLPNGSFHLSPGRTLGYGRLWSVSTFRCLSQTIGMKCWSTLTGHGFFISRDTRRIY